MEGDGNEHQQQLHQTSNPINPQTENLLDNHQNPNEHTHQTPEWVTLAQAWLSTLPDANGLNPSDVESWLESNRSSLPDQVKSMPRPELYERLALIWNGLSPSSEEKDANQIDHSQARFQRTDQWKPVYTWLESLDTDEPIKSTDVLDWLTENREVREDLYARHSRYHLMHYIKKCHVKILKRKERKKELPITTKTNSPRVYKNVEKKPKVLVPVAARKVSNLPKDSEVYLAKRNEAFRKFQILVEMKKQLSVLFPEEAAETSEG